MDLRIAFIALAGALLMGCAASAAPPSEPRKSAAPTDSAKAVRAEEIARQGEQAAENGDTVRAEQYLALAIEMGADRERLLPLLLKVCLSSFRLRAALNHAKPYLREHPEDDPLRYLVATIHLGLGEKEEARKRLEELVERNPTNVDALYLLGVLDSEIDPDRAREYLQRYLELSPSGRHAAEVRSRLLELRIADTARSPVRVRKEARR